MYKFIVGLVILVCVLLYFAEQKPAPVVVETPAPAAVEESEPKRTKHGRIDCNDAPEQAMVSARLSAELLEHVNVECYTYGHIVGAQEGFVWNLKIERHGETYLPTPLTMAALLPDGDSGSVPVVNHEAHFVSITHRALGEAEVNEQLSTIAKTFTTMPEPEQPSATEIVAVNHEGVEQRVYVVRVNEKTIVGYGCRPECEADKIFSLLEWKTYWGVPEAERRALDASVPGS